MEKFFYQLPCWLCNRYTLRKWKVPPQLLLWLGLLVGILFIQPSKGQAQCEPIIHTGDFMTASFVTACTNSQNLQVQAGASNYNWQFSADGGANFSSVGNNSNFYTATQAGLYKVAVNFSTCSMTFSSVVQVQFISAPTILEGGFLTACAPNTVQLTTQTGAISYNWQFSDNGGATFMSIGTNSPTISANSTGIYKVGAVHSCGTLFSTVTQVEFQSAGIPTILEGAFVSACGNAPTLSATSSPLGYGWEFKPQGGIFAPIAGNQQFISATNSGEYRVKFISSCTPQFSSVTQVQFISAPTILEGGFLTACAPNTVQLTTQTGAISYNWQFSDNGGATFMSIGTNSPTISANSTGIYKVGAVHSCGTLFSTVTQVEFQSAGIPTILEGAFVSACGNAPTLSATSSPLGYGWEFKPQGGIFAPIAGNQQFISATNSGEYRVKFISSCTPQFSSVTQVQFISAPTILEGGFLTACASNASQLSTQTGAISYQWNYSNNGGATFTSVSGNTPMISANSAGLYKVGAEYSCGTLFSTITQVQFTTSAVIPIIAQGAFVSACTGGNNVLFTSTNATNYQWNFSPNNTAFVSVGGNNNQISFTSAGFYKVGALVGCDWGFSSVTQVHFTSSNVPIIQQGQFLSACATNPPTLNAQSGRSGYIWEFRPNVGMPFNTIGGNSSSLVANQTGDYRVKFISSCQPNQFSSVTQVRFDSVATIQEGAFVSACKSGAKPVLHTTTGASAYQWEFAAQQGDPFITLTGKTTPFLTAEKKGLYRVGTNLGCGMQFTSATQVEFVTAIPLSITEAPFISGCPNRSVTLHIQNAGTGSIQWQKIEVNGLDFNYIDIPGATTNTLNVFASGSYRVRFTSTSGGCLGIPSEPVEVRFTSGEKPLINTDAIDPYAWVYKNQQGTATTSYEWNGGQKWQVAVCNGGSIELKTETGAQSYQWEQSTSWNVWTPIAGGTSSTLAVTQANRWYRVKVTRQNGCASDSRPMYVMAASGSVSTPVFATASPIMLQSGQVKLRTNITDWRCKFQYTPTLNDPFTTLPTGYPDFQYDWRNRQYVYVARKPGFYRAYNTNGCEVLFSSVIEVRENGYNDPPHFEIVGQSGWWYSVRVSSDVGAYTQANFVTAIDDGDSDLTQNVRFVVTTRNPEYFEVQPFIDSDGTLRFTPDPSRGGWTELSVVAKDDGATFAPNNNTSPTQRAYIWIAPKNYVFLDKNKNGVYDKASEHPLAQSKVKVRRKSWWWWRGSAYHNYTTYTGNDGSYYAYVYPYRSSPGYYKYELNAGDYPAGSTFVPTKYEDSNVTQRGYLSGKHFAVQTSTAVEDVSVEVMNWWSWRNRPGDETYYYIKCKNNSTEIKNTVVSFKYDDLLTFKGDRPIYYYWFWWWWGDRQPNYVQLLANTNNTASWTCNNMLPGEVRYIRAKMRINQPTSSQRNPRTYVSAEIKATSTDNNPHNNKYSLSRSIRYNPGGRTEEEETLKLPNKQVTPSGDISPQFVKEGKYLTYQLHFQNTSDKTVTNIKVEDIMSDKLDLSTLVMTGSTHEYKLEIDSTNANKAIWNFENISVPTSTADDVESHIQFSYRVKIKNDGTAKLNDTFGSKAYISMNFATVEETNQPNTRIWVDGVAPQQVALSPANGTTSASVNSDLILEFDESIQANSGRIYLRKADGTLFQTVDIQGDEVTISGNVLRLDVNDFTIGQTYYVQMDEGAVTDIAKNEFAGISDDKTWRFTANVKSTTITTPPNTNTVVYSNFKFPIPEQVTGLEQKEIGAGRISLSWTAPATFIEGYKVLRRTGNGDFDTLAITKYAFFTDESAEPNTLYEYKILAFNNGGHSESEVLVIQTLPLTPVLEKAQVVICEGGEATLAVANANVTDSLRWYTDEATTTSFGLGAAISVSKAGTYYVARFQNGKESERASVQAIINPIPKAEIQAGERTFCGEGTIEAELVSGASYTWKNANGQVVGEGRSLDISQSGNYTVTVELGGCSATSQSVFVKINPSNLNPEILEGKKVEFCSVGELNAKEIPEVEYIWTKDGNVLSDTSAKLKVTESGRYALQITKAGCQSNFVNTEVEIVVPETPQVIVGLTEIYPSQKTTLRTYYLKNARLQWYKDGQVLEGQFKNRLTVSEAGEYFVKAIYKTGCETVSQTISITTKKMPLLVFTNGKLMLTGEFDGADIRSVEWYQDGKAIYGFDGEPTKVGIYTVIVTLKDGTELELEGVTINDKVLGTEEENSYGFKVYPNPTTGIFNLSAQNDYLGKVQILITDMTGKTVYQKVLKKTSETMIFTPDISQWSKGAYLMKVKFGDKQIVRTIIKE